MLVMPARYLSVLLLCALAPVIAGAASGQRAFDDYYKAKDTKSSEKNQGIV